MLKTLRVVSFIVTPLSLLLAFAVVMFGLKDDSVFKAFLQRPGILERVRDGLAPAASQKDTVSPLVVQARIFAQRIAPPTPKDAEAVTREPKGKTDQGGEGSRTEIIKTEPPIQQPKFNLLATVRYVSAPGKSLALFQSGGRQEWFYEGQTVGRYKIGDINDGRVTLLQTDRGSKEILVPPKSNGPSLLAGG